MVENLIKRWKMKFYLFVAYIEQKMCENTQSLKINFVFVISCMAKKERKKNEPRILFYVRNVII